MHGAGGSTVSLSPLQTLVSAILLIGALAIIKITLLSQRFIQHINLAAAGGAVLGVLLVLRVEVVDGVRHDVTRVHRLPGKYLSSLKNIQYCQVWNINILNRVCRELTRLSRSKNTLVNILTIGQTEHP